MLARPGLPLQTAKPAAYQSVQYTTAYSNAGYQTQPTHHAQPATFQQPFYNGAATVISTHNGVPMQSAQPIHTGLPVQTVQPTHVQPTTVVYNMGTHAQRPLPGQVIVAPIPPSNWMTLSIFSVIFCTLPFGIIAFAFSYLVNDSLKRGDHERAIKNSNIAKWLNVLAIITGIPLSVFILYAIIYLR